MADPNTVTTVLSFLLPSLFGALSAVVVAMFLRRSSREANTNTNSANKTDQFEAVTNALFKRVEQLEISVNKLEEKDKKSQKELATRDEEIRVIRVELSEAKRVNGALARYLKKLMRSWPQGANVPLPDEPLDLERFV